MSKNYTKSDYFIGLDIGTESLGWAVTDESYNILRFNDKPMWGVRLFEKAKTAEERRMQRSARRRLNRRITRLGYLKEMFFKPITSIDPKFFFRLEHSYLYKDARTDKREMNGIPLYGKEQVFHLFEGGSVTDRKYHKAFKTIYHLRKALIEGECDKYSSDLYDPRLVYLALYGLLKNRGHFLLHGDIDMESYKSGETLSLNFEELASSLELEYEKPIRDVIDKVKGIYKGEYELKKGEMARTRSDKAKALKTLLVVQSKETDGLLNDEEELSAKKKLFALLLELSLGKEAAFNSKNTLLEDLSAEQKFDFENEKREEFVSNLKNAYEPLGKALDRAYEIYMWQLLNKVLKDDVNSISAAKCKAYDLYHTDLAWLKSVIKEILKSDNDRDEKYKKIFASYSRDVDDCNYGAYSTGKKGQGLKEFKKFIDAVVGKSENADVKGSAFDAFLELPGNKDYKNRISEGTFLTLQRHGEDASLPNQVVKGDVKAILTKAKEHLGFLNDKDESGLSVADKILMLVSFRIPYYVGPLAYTSKNAETSDEGEPMAEGKSAWLVRNKGYERAKITPWNFDKAVNETETRKHFIERMTSYCSCLPSKKVLPSSSLLYQKYAVLNELNGLNVSINGCPSFVWDSEDGVKCKQYIYENLCKNTTNITKTRLISAIITWCNENGIHLDTGKKLTKDDINMSVDENNKFKGSLSSYIALKDIHLSEDTAEDEERKEALISIYTIFGEESEIAEVELNNKYAWYKALGENVKKELSDKLRGLSGWGKFSKELLRMLLLV